MVARRGVATADEGAPDEGSALLSEPVLLLPLPVAALAVSIRRGPRWAYLGRGVALAVALALVWFRVANPGHALAAPGLVVGLPVAAGFWAVSRERFARKPVWAFVVGLIVVVGASFVALVVGVNLEVLFP